MRWYYETGFRRYVRGLEKMRLRAVERSEPLGEVTLGSKTSLALLARKNSVVSGAASAPTLQALPMALDHAEIRGPGVAPAYMANDITFVRLQPLGSCLCNHLHALSQRPPPEALFRSVSLVLMDNAETEHSFVATFFGQHSVLPPPTPRSESQSRFSPPLPDPPRDEADGESVGGSEAGKTSVTGSIIGREERGEKLLKAVIEGLWKSVMEPAQEYARARLFQSSVAGAQAYASWAHRTSLSVFSNQHYPRPPRSCP